MKKNPNIIEQTRNARELRKTTTKRYPSFTFILYDVEKRNTKIQNLKTITKPKLHHVSISRAFYSL